MTKLSSPVIKLSATLLTLCLALSACSGAAAPNGSEALSPPSADGAEGSANAKETGRNGPGSDKRGPDQDDGKASEGIDSSGRGPSGGAALPARSRPGVSGVRDAAGDQEGEGDIPPWVDLVGGELRESNSDLAATAHVATTIPARMPDRDTVAVIHFSLNPPKGEEAHLYAEGTSEGWKGYFSRGDRRIEMPPGDFSRSGSTLSWTVPWTWMGNAKRLDWSLHLSWTQTTLLRVNYAFDSAPDSGTERLRRR